MIDILTQILAHIWIADIHVTTVYPASEQYSVRVQNIFLQTIVICSGFHFLVIEFVAVNQYLITYGVIIDLPADDDSDIIQIETLCGVY